ncbi:MAG TPA: hypothetical protein VL486_02485 [Verrucomicrobiae bacterium]|nr:hypothetical protein [Verrucomicrobiae bacterium]
MSPDPNIFDGLVYNENSATELLRNLMWFGAFRRPLLTLLFSNECAEKIEFANIETQRSLGKFGRPDIVVDNDEIFAILEIKVKKWCPPTDSQPAGYLNALRDKKHSRKGWLAFLIPKGWDYEQALREELESYAQDYTINVRKTPVYWEDVLEIIKSNNLQDLNPFFGEFYRLLIAWYGSTPIDFSEKERIMLFPTEAPTFIEAINKLGKLIDEVCAKNGTFRVSRSRENTLWPDEYIYTFEDEQRQDVFFFGMSTRFWKKKGIPLCFGVNNIWPAPVQAAFHGSCKNTMPFEDYTVGWVSEETLALKNPVEEILKQLAPILSAIANARRGSTAEQ